MHLQISVAQRGDENNLDLIIFNISLFQSQLEDSELTLAGRETCLVRSMADFTPVPFGPGSVLH